MPYQRPLSFCVLAITCVLAGCADSSHPIFADPLAAPIGHDCVVVLRADALGLGAPSDTPDEETPPPSDESIPSYLSGKLVQLNSQWIVLRDKESHIFYIPRESVLAVSVEDKPAKSK